MARVWQLLRTFSCAKEACRRKATLKFLNTTLAGRVDCVPRVSVETGLWTHGTLGNGSPSTQTQTFGASPAYWLQAQSAEREDAANKGEVHDALRVGCRLADGLDLPTSPFLRIHNLIDLLAEQICTAKSLPDASLYWL
jgi:hypothetical protein